jgi:16S rRNA (cytosine1402-N4)-methyltransferase
VHVPVLAGPALEWLAVREDGTYVDCTAGAGGHSELIARRLGSGRLIALDRDPAAVKLASERLTGYANAQVVQRNYDELRKVLEERGIDKVNGVLLDAGLSSMQIDDASRGFSFQGEGPLDMRMDTTRGETAAEFLRRCRERELETLLREFGDVGPAGRIARQIVADAASGQLNTTYDLARSVRSALPFVAGEPAEVRTVFQAVRIALNRELESLESALTQAIDALAPGGRLVAIAFHSGEDRVIKRALQTASRPQRELWPDGRVRKTTPPQLKLLTPKPVVAGESECKTNPRAHSAKLRAAERLNAKELE